MAPPQPPNNNTNQDPRNHLAQLMANISHNHPSGGVDHAGPDNTSYPTFWPGFPAGPPPNPPGRHHNHGHHHYHRRRFQHPELFSWGARDADAYLSADGQYDFSDTDRGPRHHGRRGRRHHDTDDEDGTRERPVDLDEKNEKSARDETSNTTAGEKSGSPDTMREDFPDPDEMVPEYDEAANEPFTFAGAGRWGYGHGWRGRGGRGGCARGHFGRHHHHHHHHQDRSGFPFPSGGFGGGGGFPNLPEMMQSLAGHPIVQSVLAAMRSAAGAEQESDDAFAPPVDVFDTPGAYVVHVALPGARREDVGVRWDAARGTLSVAGVVHRPGDEAFLRTLRSSERRVGLFSREVALPPEPVPGQGQGQGSAAQREVVDGEAIEAKLDDGVLVVLVPKSDKEWTEVRKVDVL